MNRRSTNRILGWAVALSLGAHAFVAMVVHTIPPAQAEPETPTRVEIIRVATPPPPTPTPRPVVQPQRRPAALQNVNRAPSHHVALTPPHVAAHGASNAGPAVPVAGGSPEPSDVQTPAGPAATPAPSCSQPYVAAHTIDAIAPTAPDDAAGMQGTAEVQVSLDAAGRVIDARIYQSTGSMSLDRVALAAARRSTYAPQIVNCEPAGGTYLFRVDFQD